MRSIAFVATMASLLSCRGERVNDSTTHAEPAGDDSTSISGAALTGLADARIYFGHQSVGTNIIEGLRDLSARNGIPLRFVKARERNLGTSGIVEFFIGENGRPESKMKDFAEALRQIDDTASAIAVFKYCYLDFTPETSVALLFAGHREAMHEMRVRHPNLTFVHVTVPLTRLESGPRFLVKRLLGKPTTRDANVRRNKFNELLRNHYASEPIFDLAKVESTRPNGSRSFFNDGTDVVYTLASELTDDGGHLNEAGRRVAAEEFAAVIASVKAGRRPATPRETL